MRTGGEVSDDVDSYTRDAVSAARLHVADVSSVVNARLRRIDLLCKLLGPLAISMVAAVSTRLAIWTLLGMNVASVLVEYVCIARVCIPSPASSCVDMRALTDIMPCPGL